MVDKLVTDLFNTENFQDTRYYDFNEEITIVPPLTESGELEEGWIEMSMDSLQD